MSPARGWAWRMSRTTWVVAGIAISCLLSSCRGSAGDALLVGRLYGDEVVGCVWIGEPEGGLEIDWPSGISVRSDPVQVAGRGWVANEGDWFRLSGGTDPDTHVTRGCPVPEPSMGLFVPDTVEYFGRERPSSELEDQPNTT